MPDAAETERLSYLMEECAEVVQAAAKVQRNGYEGGHPREPGGPDNRARLERDIADVLFAIRMMGHAGDIELESVEAAIESKRRRAKRSFRHQDAFFSSGPGLRSRLTRG